MTQAPEQSVGQRPDINFTRLSMYLKALSNPNRLELLYQLRFPRTATEITLTPKRSESTGNPKRPISRQAVEEHLRVLQSIGVVTTRRSTRETRPVDEYVVNHPALFAVTEEMRKLSLIRSHTHIGAGETQTATSTVVATADTGPRLVLVSGVWEGKCFPLDGTDPSDPARWTIGRREGVAISLDYDPFISHENCNIVRRGEDFVLIDNASSRNGTLLNWAPMPRGGEHILTSGDLIGVGRSMLMFRRD